MGIFCTSESNAFTQIDCGIDWAGIYAFAIVDESVQYETEDDLASESWWNDRIDAGEVNIIKITRGEYLGAKPEEAAGFAMDPVHLVGAKHEASVEFLGIKENRDFADEVNLAKRKLALVTSGGKLIWIDVPVTMYFKLIIAKDKNASSIWQGLLKWDDFDLPIIVDEPANIFDKFGELTPVWKWESGLFVQWYSGANVDLE